MASQWPLPSQSYTDPMCRSHGLNKPPSTTGNTGWTNWSGSSGDTTNNPAKRGQVGRSTCIGRMAVGGGDVCGPRAESWRHGGAGGPQRLTVVHWTAVIHLSVNNQSSLDIFSSFNTCVSVSVRPWRVERTNIQIHITQNPKESWFEVNVPRDIQVHYMSFLPRQYTPLENAEVTKPELLQATGIKIKQLYERTHTLISAKCL